MRTSLVLCGAIALALGCGGGTSMPMDSGPTGPDPMLLGSWFNQVTDPTADNQTETVTFASDGTMTAVHAQTNSASSSDHAGCIETVTETGTYSTRGGMITMTPSAGMPSRSYASCTDPTEDGPGTPASPIFFTSGATTSPYSISGDTLTLVGIAFTRI